MILCKNLTDQGIPLSSIFFFRKTRYFLNKYFKSVYYRECFRKSVLMLTQYSCPSLAPTRPCVLTNAVRTEPRRRPQPAAQPASSAALQLTWAPREPQDGWGNATVPETRAGAAPDSQNRPRRSQTWRLRQSPQPGTGTLTCSTCPHREQFNY